jgi:hypothetical protein
VRCAYAQRSCWATRGKRRCARERGSAVRYARLRAEIEALWFQPERRRVDSWLEHANINDVVLATSLRPEAFL